MAKKKKRHRTKLKTFRLLQLVESDNYEKLDELAYDTNNDNTRKKRHNNNHTQEPKTKDNNAQEYNHNQPKYTPSEKRKGRKQTRGLKQRLIQERGHICEIPNCGWIWTIELHHCDDDCTHNSPDNAVLLCPSHHSLTISNRKPTEYSQDAILTTAYFRKLLSEKYGYKYD